MHAAKAMQPSNRWIPFSAFALYWAFRIESQCPRRPPIRESREDLRHLQNVYADRLDRFLVQMMLK